jgi:hypothetical protein
VHILYRKIVLSLSILENIRDRQVIQVFNAGGLNISRSVLTSMMRSPGNAPNNPRYRKISLDEITAFLVGYIKTADSVPGQQIAQYFLDSDLLDRSKIDVCFNFLDQVSQFALGRRKND